MIRRWLETIAVLLLVAGSAATARAQFSGAAGASDGITVQGTGEMAVRPNLVEVDLSVAGSAELTGDALVKYRDARKRVEEALAALNLSGVEVAEVGLGIAAGGSLEQQQRMMQGMVQQGATKNQIDVTSALRVTLKDVREMPPEDLLKTVGRLLDVAQDSGVTIGPSPRDMMQAYRFGNYNQFMQMPVRFVVADLAELREKAYELAIQDARGRASRLAKLTGVKLGPALAVQEISVAGDQPSVPTTNYAYNIANARPTAPELASEPRVVSSSLARIPVQVKLMVRFAIEPDRPATAQK